MDKRKLRGSLRVKQDIGVNTDPVRSESGKQTWTEVTESNNIYTMSCSDKICRWNLIGIQGALLSHLIEPVYDVQVLMVRKCFISIGFISSVDAHP